MEKETAKHEQLPNGLNGLKEKSKLYSRKRERDIPAEAVVHHKRTKQMVKGPDNDERVSRILGKTADILLVLAGLSQLRGGKPPSEMETQLAEEAHSNLSSLVSRISPHSLVSKSSLENMLGTMGLRKNNEGTIEPAPRLVETKMEGVEPDSDDESSESLSGKEDEAQIPSAGLLTSPSALSLDDETDTEFKQGDDYDEFQDDDTRNRHIARIVQAIKAQTYIPLPAAEVTNAYMVTVVQCENCRMFIKDTASVIMCDGCEKAYHVKCLPHLRDQPPKGDWSCLRCNGVKPRYGPVKKSTGQTPNKMPIRKPDAKPPSTPPPAVNGPADNSKPNIQQKVTVSSPAKPEASESITPPQNVEQKDETVTGEIKPDEADAMVGGQVLHVDWVGDPTEVVNKRAYYSSCSVGGWTYKLQDCALFRPESPEIPPYIARLQTLWEDLETGSKWVRVNWCYYPNDMPSVAGIPDAVELDEVFESNHCDNNLVGSIIGPCQVLVSHKYQEEKERRERLGLSPLEPHPFFLCKWFYDAPKGVFTKVVEGSRKIAEN